MSAAARTYIRDTVAGLVPSTLPAFRYRDIDGGRGRDEAELVAAVGATRLFELTDGAQSAVDIAGPSIVAVDRRPTLRVRYEAGHTNRVTLIDTVQADQIQIIKALREGAWSAVSGLAALTADPGRIDAVEGEGGAVVAYVAEVDIYISVDV